LCNASHVGNASLPFSCVLQFTSDSASLVLSFALDVPLRTPPFPSTSTYALSSRCRRNRHRLAENPQLALHKVCASLFSITYDGSMVAQKCSCLLIWSFKFCPFFSPVFRMLYAPLTTSFLNRHFFHYTPLLVHCPQDWLPRSPNACTVLISVHTLLGSPS
jgi:hypothetical protein